ncbi:MAG TPA: glycosyltransferase family 2 protein [Gemmatimonadales bacterium]|nr:glycosyltransferase family 2 protein [Gemmatimonadales bacterium]
MKSLSVVIPSVNGWGDLEGCLQALERQRTDADLDVLVVDRIGNGIREQVRQRFPRVTVIPAPPGTTIPDLRAMAFERARADSVAVIEDHVLVPEGWAAQLLAAQARGEEVVGGSVDNAATTRLIDWAAFLCEYSQLLPPLPEGPVPGLTGNNTVYRRSLLEKHRDATRAGRWENYLHDALRRDGVVLYQRPEIRVGHKKHYTAWEYLSQRFLYARSYAGVRVQGASLLRRLFYGLAAFALPPVLFLRVVRTVWRKGRHRSELLRSIPLLTLFVSSWGLGEVVGYWFGAGDALSKVC